MLSSPGQRTTRGLPAIVKASAINAGPFPHLLTVNSEVRLRRHRHRIVLPGGGVLVVLGADDLVHRARRPAIGRSRAPHRGESLWILDLDVDHHLAPVR